MKKLFLFIFLLPFVGYSQVTIRPTVNAGTLGGHPDTYFWSKSDTGSNGKLAGYDSTAQSLGLKVNKANWDG